MSEDNHLKKMYAAQREVDERLVPPFEGFVENFSPAEESVSVNFNQHLTSLATPGALLLATAILIVVGLVFWNNLSSRDETTIATKAHTDSESIDQVCYSIQKRIQKLNLAHPNSETASLEMAWPTETDSLIPFATLNFRSRTTP